MIEVHYPEPKFKIKKEGERHFIFDAIRKVWLQLTDEEWVRQNFVVYLIQVLNYPATRIALEKGLNLNGLRKRFDILVYDATHKPWMMIECKAAGVALNEEVLQQVMRYSVSIPVNYLIITNGKQTIGWVKKNGHLEQLITMPTP